MRDRWLEQVFVRPKGAGLELLLVSENAAGARFRDTLFLPTRTPREALRRLARHLAQRGEVRGAPRLRLRLERGGELRDDRALQGWFRELLEAELKGDPRTP